MYEEETDRTGSTQMYTNTHTHCQWNLPFKQIVPLIPCCFVANELKLFHGLWKRSQTQIATDTPAQSLTETRALLIEFQFSAV